MGSSPNKGLCLHCKAETTQLRDGWKLRDGGFSKLCDSCGSAYEKGAFCSKFHLDSDGWRYCLVCGKMIHCGCIMSYHMYETLDFGGVCCTGCAEESTILSANQYRYSTTSELSRDLGDSLEAEHPFDSGKMISGLPSHAQCPASQFEEQNKSSFNGAGTIMEPFVGKQTSLQSDLDGPPSQPHSPEAHSGEQNEDSPNGAGTLVDPSLVNETSLHSDAPSSPSQIQSPEAQFGEQNKGSLNGAQTPVNPFVDNQTSKGETSVNLPEITDKELPKASENSSSVLVLLFEKFLTVSDADHKLARLVLPKLCAEVYFPFTSEGQRYPIEVQDITGKDWRFYFRVWRHGYGRMYVLEGLKKYMDLMDWQAGDKVLFYRMGSEGKFVIETKKVSSDSAPFECASRPASSKEHEDVLCLRSKYVKKVWPLLSTM